MNSNFKIALWTLMLIYGGAVCFNGDGYVQAMNNRSNSLLDEVKFHYNDKNVYRLNQIVNEKYSIFKDIVLNDQITEATLQLVDVLIYIKDNVKQSEKVNNLLDILINRCIDVIKDRIIDIDASNDDSIKKGKIKAAKQLPEYKILSSNYVRSENALQKKLTLKQRSVLSLVRLDNYTAFIAGRHFKNIDDYVNLELANKHFSGNITKYFYSPVESIKPEELKFFPNIKTLYLNNKEDIERFLEYNPTNDFIKNLPEGHLKNNKGKFIAVEVHAPVDYDNAKIYLEKLNKLLVDWNLTEDATDQEKDTLRKKLIGHVKFLNVSVDCCEDIGRIDDETGVFVFNDDIYTGDKWLRADGEYYINKNKTYFIKTIQDCAFSDREELTSITIPNSVTEIEYMTFSNCPKLTSITIPDSVQFIGEGSFAYCYGLTSITIPDSVKSIGGGLFTSCKSLKSITLSDSIKSISAKTFEHCTSLEQITIPDSVRSISSSAFRSCTSLRSITIPDSVYCIDSSAFANCSNELEFHVPSNAMKHYLIDNLQINESQIKVDIKRSAGAWVWNVDSDGTLNIPDDVTELSSRMFYQRKDIESIVIPKTVKSIGNYAFTNCTGLSKIIIPDSVTSIRCGAFYGCKKLKNFTIGKNVRTIGPDAFYGCKELTQITLTDNVDSIGMSAFLDCPKLENIYIICDRNISDSKKKAMIEQILRGSNSYFNVKKNGLNVPTNITIKFIDENSNEIAVYKGGQWIK